MGPVSVEDYFCDFVREQLQQQLLKDRHIPLWTKKRASIFFFFPP